MGSTGNDGRLYVSDLDGTLLDGDGRLSDFTRRELTRLLDEGLRFTVASARSVATMRIILGDLPLKLPVIEFNGAFISDYGTGRHRFVRAMRAEVAAEVAAQAARSGVPAIVSTWDGAADRVYYTHVANDGIGAYVTNRENMGDPRLRRVESLDEGLAEEVVCLTIVHQRPVLEEIQSWAVERYGNDVKTTVFEDLYTEGGWHWLTVHHPHATKAHALRELADGLGVAMEDITVFGDDLNDLPLFEAAGHAVAVANARETVMAASDEIIGPHTEDAVVRYLAGRWDAWPSRKSRLLAE